MAPFFFFQTNLVVTSIYPDSEGGHLKVNFVSDLFSSEKEALDAFVCYYNKELCDDVDGSVIAYTTETDGPDDVEQRLVDIAKSAEMCALFDLNEWRFDVDDKVKGGGVGGEVGTDTNSLKRKTSEAIDEAIDVKRLNHM